MSAPFEPNEQQVKLREYARKNEYNNRVGVHPLPVFDVSLEAYDPDVKRVFEHEEELGFPNPGHLPLRKICVICDLPSRDVICEDCYREGEEFSKGHPWCSRCLAYVELLANGSCVQCELPPFG